MAEEIWTWADLDDRELRLVQEAERTLGADYVLAYRRGDRLDSPVVISLKPAPLDKSQLECLQGVERLVEAVTVAYVRV